MAQGSGDNQTSDKVVVDKRAILARHYLFCDLEDQVIDRVADLGLTTRLTAGQLLFRKGDDGNALFGVLEGKVRISTSSPNGREVIISVMEPGDVFGEIALLDGLPRTADARTLEPCTLLKIQRRDFRPLLEREPKLCLHLLELLCERLRWTTELIEDATFLGLPARLAKRLLNLAIAFGEEEADGHGIRIGLRLSQNDLGRMLGTSRESVNKHLQDWTKKGWIALGRNRISVLDQSALQAVLDEETAEL